MVGCKQAPVELPQALASCSILLPTPTSQTRHAAQLPAAEFEVRDVTLPGDLSFEVPDGHRMLVTAGPDGTPHVELQPLSHPSWQWQYRMGRGGEVQLELLEIESATDA